MPTHNSGLEFCEKKYGEQLIIMDFGFRIQDPDPGLGLDWKFGVRNLDFKFRI